VIDVETIRREEFPITRRGIYLDNATLGPPPARHVRAVTAFLERMSAEGLDDLFAIGDEGVIACCSDRALAELKVRQIGWNSVENPFNVDGILAFDMRFPPSAKRFEPSFQPLPQVFGLGATLDLFHEVGTGAIESTCCR